MTLLSAVLLQLAWSAPPQTLEPTLSTDFLHAVDYVFTHGVPDPRGGEFREVTIISGGPWQGRTSRVHVTGWVLPARRGLEQTVVCWNGLPYRPLAVGPKRDLAEFVELRANGRAGGSEVTVEWREAGVPSLGLGVALLVRVGRPDLAQILGAPKMYPGFRRASLLAEDVLWFRYNRACLAHRRGDDALVLADAKWLLERRQAIRSLIGRSGGGFTASYDGKPLYLDAMRRLARKPARQPLDLARLRLLPPAARAAEIVDRLDDVGTFDVVNDPLLTFAKGIERELVDALLERAPKENRLARAVGFWREYRRERQLETVLEAEQSLLRRLGGLRIGAANGLAGVDWAAVKKEWQATRALTPAERLLRVLADDSRSEGQWMSAVWELTWPDPNSPKLMLGESLRRRKNPSLSELMVKRLRQVLGAKIAAYERAWSSLSDPLSMAADVLRWDPSAAVPVLRELSAQTRSMSDRKDRQGRNTWDDMAEAYANLVGLRMSAGDLSGAEQYEARLLNCVVPSGDDALQKALLPLTLKPDWGDKVARQLLVGPDAVWDPVGQLRKGHEFPLRSLIAAELLSLPAVRECLREALADRTPVGEIWRDERDEWFTRLRSEPAFIESRSGVWVPSGEPVLPPGGSAPIRACDLVAKRLGSFRGAPAFKLEWTVEARDAALVDVIRYVVDSGSRLAGACPWKVASSYR